MNRGKFQKGQAAWNKGKLKIQDPNEIRTCKTCKQEKIITDFTKGKGNLYRYQCKKCRQNERRTGRENTGRFKPGKHPGKEFQKGHTPWYKIKGINPPALGKGIKETRFSAKSTNWKKQVKERDKYICQKCGSKNRVAAHHIISWKDDENLRFNVDNGITLCCSCHALEEGLGTKIKPKA